MESCQLIIDPQEHFNKLPSIITSYVTTIQYQNQDIDIYTLLLTRL